MAKVAPPRALIIAIENYPNAVGMATKLEGTNKAGNDFWEWFVEKKIKPLSTTENPLDPKDLVFGCVDHPYEWRTAGTTCVEVFSQVEKLVETGSNNTAELYFFFAGHGLLYTDRDFTRAIDVLVCSDFTTKNKSGRACLQLQEVQEQLWSAMGPGHHYYFVDACRNRATHEEIKLAGTGVIFTASAKKKPYRYTLYSTIKGMAAEVDSGFSTVLVAGLAGSGRAKAWDEEKDELWVRFNSLSNYVGAKLPDQTVDPNNDGGEGRILHLDPIPESECKIKIENASAADKFKLVAKARFRETGPFEFKGDTFSLKLPPFFYNLELTHASLPVVQIDPDPKKALDLFDNCEVKFQLSTPGLAALPPSPPAPAAAMFEVVAPHFPEAEVELTDVVSGIRMRGDDLPLTRALPGARMARPRLGKVSGISYQGEVQPGTYIARVRERGITVRRQRVTVEAGETVKVDLLKQPKSKTREDLLRAIAVNPKATAVVLPSLSPTANMDLSLWLSLFGAGRILGSTVKKELEKFEGLQLDSFDDINAGESCVYLLTAFEKSTGSFAAGLSTGPKVKCEPLRAVPNLTSVYQWRKKAKPGPQLLTLQLPEQVPATFATYCLPNRVTFMVVAQDAMGRLDVRHYMLPVGKLIQHLEPKVREQIESNPMSLVRYMSLVQSQFARKRSLEPAENTDEAYTWRELVYGKWVDPVISLIAAYFFIRKGAADPEAPEQDKWLLNEVTKNLRTYFGDLPDVAIIERAMGKKRKLSEGAPLILDGASLLGKDAAKVLPLPQGQLDYNGPWTSWRGAVITSGT